MAKKESCSRPRRTQGKLAGGGVLADLTEAERNVVSHMEQGWRLETDSLGGGNPVLRSLKENGVIRPLSANRSTVEALAKGAGLLSASQSPSRGDLERRSEISSGDSCHPFAVSDRRAVWLMTLIPAPAGDPKETMEPSETGIMTGVNQFFSQIALTPPHCGSEQVEEHAPAFYPIAPGEKF